MTTAWHHALCLELVHTGSTCCCSAPTDGPIIEAPLEPCVTALDPCCVVSLALKLKARNQQFTHTAHMFCVDHSESATEASCTRTCSQAEFSFSKMATMTCSLYFTFFPPLFLFNFNHFYHLNLTVLKNNPVIYARRGQGPSGLCLM